jgi:hypothetical protein
MNIAEEIAGTWVKNEDMHPITNIAGRRYWAEGVNGREDIEGIFHGTWFTHRGERPQGVYWFFPSQVKK